MSIAVLAGAESKLLSTQATHVQSRVHLAIRCLDLTAELRSRPSPRELATPPVTVSTTMSIVLMEFVLSDGHSMITTNAPGPATRF
jgi:hypothetical protein